MLKKSLTGTDHFCVNCQLFFSFFLVFVFYFNVQLICLTEAMKMHSRGKTQRQVKVQVGTFICARAHTQLASKKTSPSILRSSGLCLGTTTLFNSQTREKVSGVSFTLFSRYEIEMEDNKALLRVGWVVFFFFLPSLKHGSDVSPPPLHE